MPKSIARRNQIERVVANNRHRWYHLPCCAPSSVRILHSHSNSFRLVGARTTTSYTT